MQTIAEIKAEIRQLKLKVINYQTSSFVVLLTAEQKADFEAAEKELDILYKKERLEELRAEIQSEGISTGELLELQSLIPYIDKGDVELLEWAGVGEEQLTEENIDITLKYTEDEPTDLFETPELIPDNVRAVFDKYDNGDELSYDEIFKLHTEVEELGYTFDYYLDAVPYDLRKIETNS
jgi:hypothetical protein